MLGCSSRHAQRESLLRGAHDITADVELIPVQQVNQAFERLLRSDVKYRFTVDMASLRMS